MMESQTDKSKNAVTNILAITMEIKKKFPELYKLLDETPLSVSINNSKNRVNDFEEYFNTIQAQLNERLRNENE